MHAWKSTELAVSVEGTSSHLPWPRNATAALTGVGGKHRTLAARGCRKAEAAALQDPKESRVRAELHEQVAKARADEAPLSTRAAEAEAYAERACSEAARCLAATAESAMASQDARPPLPFPQTRRLVAGPESEPVGTSPSASRTAVVLLGVRTAAIATV